MRHAHNTFDAQCSEYERLQRELALAAPLKADLNAMRGQVEALCAQMAALESKLGPILESELDRKHEQWEASQQEAHGAYRRAKWAELKQLHAKLRPGVGGGGGGRGGRGSSMANDTRLEDGLP